MPARLLFVLVAVVAGCGVSEVDHSVSTPPPPTPPSTPAPSLDAALATPAPAPADASAPTDQRVPEGVDAAPVVSEPTVVLGGARVPRSKVVVFLHIGHSNMAGRATGPADLKPYFYDTNPHLWAYAKGGVWRPATEPLSGDMDTGNDAGPGMAILHAALNAAPDSHFVSIGHGQSGLTAGDCTSYRKGGLLYDIVMTPARELVGTVTFGGIFTMLGITEHHLPEDQQHAFSDCMTGLADDMRRDLAEPALPFIVGGYELGATRADVAPSTPFAKLIIAQLALIPGKTTHADVIPTDGLPMQDDHHYNMLGYKIWADRGVGLLLTHGWAPWAKP